MHCLFRKTPRDFFLTLCVGIWLLELKKCINLTQNQAVKREQHQCDAITYLHITSGCVLKKRAKTYQLDIAACSCCCWPAVRMSDRSLSENCLSKVYFKVNLVSANSRQGGFKSLSSCYWCDRIYFRAG